MFPLKLTVSQQPIKVQARPCKLQPKIQLEAMLTSIKATVALPQ